MVEPILIIVSCSSREEAFTIANQLLEKRYVACAQIVPGVESLFWWKGKIHQSHEIQLQLKTFTPYWKKVEEKVKKYHSYDVPEIISLPIRDASQSYLDWMRSELQEIKNTHV